MNELITTCLKSGDISPLIDFPKTMVSDIEAEMIKWIVDYYSKHGIAPQLERFLDDYDIFVPIDSGLPPTDVYESEIRRRIVSIGNNLLSEAISELNDKKEIPIDLLHKIQIMSAQTSGIHSYSDFDRSLYERRAVVKLPFKIINKATSGMANGEILLVAGRLGSGKSTILRWIAKNCWEDGKRVLFVSTESLASEVFSAIDAMVMGVSLTDVREIKIKPSFKSFKRPHSPAEIYVPNVRIVSTDQIGALARSLRVDIVIIDGVYLLNPTGKTSGSKWEKVTLVSNEIKQLALDHRIPIVCSTQIKRGASNSDNWYSPEDIALSDSLGQDADFVVTMKQSGVIKNRIKLQLIKNRFGYNCATMVYIDHDRSLIVEESVHGKVKTPVETMSVDYWRSEDE